MMIDFGFLNFIYLYILLVLFQIDRYFRNSHMRVIYAGCKIKNFK